MIRYHDAAPASGETVLHPFANEDFMPITWTDATALTGVALGLWNAWRLERRSSVQLIVRPQFGGHDYGADPTLMRVRVANLSAFPVTLRRVSLVFRDEVGSYCPCDLGPPENRLPRALDPREAAVFELSVREAIAGTLHQYDHILVETECDARRRSSRWSEYRGQRLKEIHKLAAWRDDDSWAARRERAWRRLRGGLRMRWRRPAG